MRIGNILASLCVAALAFCVAVFPAYAQATRTWVSGAGNDGNACTRTSPCLTFDCLDSGGFGTVNIGKSITINCEGAIGGVQAGGGSVGILVNVTSNDIVYLRGLDIQATANGASGISLIQAGELHVEHCLIHGFNSGAASEANFLGLGIDSTAGTGAVNLALVDSVSAGNGSSIGVATLTNGAKGIASIMINRASLSGSLVGLRSNGPKRTIRIVNSEITGNTTGVLSVNGGVLQSYGNNQLNGNKTDGTMSTIALH